MLLQLKGITKRFGGIIALGELDLEVGQDEIHGLIGPNGAGKTTAFNVITGVFPPTSGRVVFSGEDMTGLRPDRVAQKGLVRTFQHRSLFLESSVLDNILVAFHMQSKAGFWRCLLNSPRSRKEESEFYETALETMADVGLKGMKDVKAKSLPHGYQRALGMAIALAAKPKMLLLDEPVTGMTPSEVKDMVELIKKIKEEKGIPILLVEHNMKAVMAVCDVITVLNFGAKIAEGLPDEIRNNSTVIEAYLGRGEISATRS